MILYKVYAKSTLVCHKHKTAVQHLYMLYKCSCVLRYVPTYVPYGIKNKSTNRRCFYVIFLYVFDVYRSDLFIPSMSALKYSGLWLLSNIKPAQGQYVFTG